MAVILTIAGIFAGIGVFLAAMYSLTQGILLDGRKRWLHVALFALILITMGALMQREVLLARVLALPLLGAGIATLWIEPRWFKVFPILVIVFSITLLLGYVALTPL